MRGSAIRPDYSLYVYLLPDPQLAEKMPPAASLSPLRMRYNDCAAAQSGPITRAAPAARGLYQIRSLRRKCRLRRRFLLCACGIMIARQRNPARLLGPPRCAGIIPDPQLAEKMPPAASLSPLRMRYNDCAAAQSGPIASGRPAARGLYQIRSLRRKCRLRRRFLLCACGIMIARQRNPARLLGPPRCAGIIPDPQLAEKMPPAASLSPLRARYNDYAAAQL